MSSPKVELEIWMVHEAIANMMEQEQGEELIAEIERIAIAYGKPIKEGEQ